MDRSTSAERAVRWRTIARNALAGTFVALLIGDGVPLVPARFRAWIHPLVRSLGITQTHWELFAPNPDSQNHQLTARVEFADGSVADWQTPDWRQESSWQRMLSHRYSKYFDNIRNPGYAEFWPTLADYIVRETQRARTSAVPPRKVTITIREGTIPDPRFYPWPPVRERTPLDGAWVLHTQEYP